MYAEINRLVEDRRRRFRADYLVYREARHAYDEALARTIRADGDSTAAAAIVCMCIGCQHCLFGNL